MSTPQHTSQASAHTLADPRQQALYALGRSLMQSAYHFTTATPATHARVLARDEAHGHGLARDLRDVFGWSRPFAPSLLPAQMLQQLDQAGELLTEGEHCRAGIRFSSLSGMLLAHSAYPTTAADSVFFGPDTYRFCSLLQHLAPSEGTVVDIGAGSGAGGLWLARSHPRREVILTDINPSALRFAQVNAALAGVTVRTVESDLFAALPDLPDLCIANPPYMRDEQRRAYRDGGGDHGEGLSVRIVREWLERARPGQSLILYTGIAIVAGQDPFQAQVAGLVEGSGATMSYEELDPDVFGEELSLPGYAEVDRIAAVGLRLRR